MKFYILLIVLALTSGCASVSNRVQEAQPYSAQINWPEEYTPEDATFYVHNKLLIDALAEKVWDELIQAETWPAWYEGAFNVDVINNDSGLLEADSVFTWKTMGLNFTSEITEFERPYRLSRVSERNFIKGYHAWLLVSQGDKTLLVTDESQHGLLAVLQGIFQPHKLHGLHDIWLAEIKAKAEDK